MINGFHLNAFKLLTWLGKSSNGNSSVQKLFGQLSQVMGTVVNIVNVIRANSLYHREFMSFLEEIGVKQQDLFYHFDVQFSSVEEKFFITLSP